MEYHCTPNTDLDELIGRDEHDGFHQGPLYTAMKRNEPLELQKSALLSRPLQAKLESIIHGLLVAETGEWIAPADHFKIVFK